MQNGFHNSDSPISAHSYQHSYETATSGSEEYGKSTNPSSQNSSYDQLHQLRKPDDFGHENPYANELRMGQPGPAKPFSPYNTHEGPYTQEPAPVAVQNYVPNNPRQPIKLNGSPSDDSFNEASSPTSPSEKKKSWIKRRFSRRDN
jgi:hypothetical protein